MRVVRFTAKVPPYAVGEIAGFEDGEAARLIRLGVAVDADAAAQRQEPTDAEPMPERPARRGRRAAGVDAQQSATPAPAEDPAG